MSSARDEEPSAEVRPLRAVEPPDPDGRASSGLSLIGPYRILDELGRGGMGVVYLAEQREPVRRRVALKLIDARLVTEEGRRRFELERQAMALMQHAHIARILESGTTDDGRPFFAMEYVKGVPITDYCDANRLSVEARLRLFRDVCHAVQHAHQKGVLHRDLKPGNILVTDQEGEPSPKIIDFGVARVVSGAVASTTLHTEYGALLGTLEYMSPEQAGLGAADVDTRTDVYALGVLLYELLTGDLPFSSRQLQRAGQLEAIRIIREVDPPKPSTRIGSSSDTAAERSMQRRTSVHTLSRELKGDLDWIVMKAIEKDRSRRYATADALANDIRRYLEGQTVEAHAPSVIYLGRKLFRRHRAALSSALGILLALTAGLVVSFNYYLDARRASHTAEESAHALEILSEDQFKVADLAVDAGGVSIRTPLPDLESWSAKLRELEQDREQLLASELMASERFPRVRDLAARWSSELQNVADKLETWTALRARLAARLEVDAARWASCIREVTADPRFAAVHLVPQLGLVPLGADPASGLQEFYHLLTAQPLDPEADPSQWDWDIPSRRTDGSLSLGDDGRWGVVLVLLPGGSREMVDYDRRDHSRRYGTEVDLDPFLASKFELTQGQWWTMTGAAPSYLSAEAELEADDEDGARRRELISWCHPLEGVDVDDALAGISPYGLDLPTEAQWEYLAAAGSSAHFASGAEPESLDGWANLADRTLSRHPGPSAAAPEGCFPAIDDGFIGTAPVGSFRPNAFGLHDVHGNVKEWCDGWGGDYRSGFSPGTGALQVDPRRRLDRVCRGGSYLGVPDSMTLSDRIVVPSAAYQDVGVRPVRRIEK